MHRANNARLIKSLTLLLAISMFAGAKSFAATKTAAKEKQKASTAPAQEMNARILSDLREISVPEQASQAIDRLNSYPREKLVQSLRDLLKNKDNVELVASAAAGLRVTELAPDFMSLAKTSDSWQVFTALAKTAPDSQRSATDQVLLQRLRQNLPAPASIAIIQNLSEGSLPVADYARLMTESEKQVRVVLVRRFLSERASYQADDQAKRFRLAFTNGSEGARLEAMNTFAQLPKDERDRMKSAFSPDLCKTEKSAEVKEACLRIKGLLQEGARK